MWYYTTGHCSHSSCSPASDHLSAVSSPLRSTPGQQMPTSGLVCATGNMNFVTNISDAIDTRRLYLARRCLTMIVEWSGLTSRLTHYKHVTAETVVTANLLTGAKQSINRSIVQSTDFYVAFRLSSGTTARSTGDSQLMSSMSAKDFLNKCVLRRRRNVANDSADVTDKSLLS